jgi:hypothetical protein
VQSDERRASYQIALLAKLQDQSLDIQPRSFANQGIEPNDRPRFLQRVAEVGLDPNQTFAKDTSRAHEPRTASSSPTPLSGSVGARHTAEG